MHSSMQCNTFYRRLPRSDTCQVKVLEAAGTCGTVRNVGELHRALGNLTHEGEMLLDSLPRSS